MYRVTWVTCTLERDNGETTVSDTYSPVYWRPDADHIKGGYWNNPHWDWHEWEFKTETEAKLLAESHAAYGKDGITELYAARERRRAKARIAARGTKTEK